jgi:hypothetical protein
MRALLNKYVVPIELVKRKIGEKLEFGKSSYTCQGRACHRAEEGLSRRHGGTEEERYGM